LVLESLLDGLNCNVIRAASGNEALSLILEYDIALALIDVQMPDMDGFETAELMRKNSRTRYIPIIFVTAIFKEQESIFNGYEIGAVDYLFKPIEPIILQSKVKVFIDLYNQKRLIEKQTELLELKIKLLLELKVTNSKLESLSICDGVTGIGNRWYFDNSVGKGWEKCMLSGKPMSIIMADIDFFKEYNDNYGHQKGDECITEVSNVIATIASRSMDFVTRYDSNEFAIVLLETDKSGAICAAEKIKKEIELLMLKHEYSGNLPYVTLSMGVTTMIPTPLLSIDEFIDNAVKGLTISKTSGHNHISYYSDSE
jgi:diguanylate cyclase (GGDEF)-like protein